MNPTSDDPKERTYHHRVTYEDTIQHAIMQCYEAQSMASDNGFREAVAGLENLAVAFEDKEGEVDELKEQLEWPGYEDPDTGETVFVPTRQDISDWFRLLIRFLSRKNGVLMNRVPVGRATIPENVR